METIMAKQRLTLYINENLVEPMKVIAVVEKHSLSELTELLYQEYLEKHKEFVKTIEKGKQKL
jgi:hypothetical protein